MTKPMKKTKKAKGGRGRPRGYSGVDAKQMTRPRDDNEHHGSIRDFFGGRARTRKQRR